MRPPATAVLLTRFSTSEGHWVKFHHVSRRLLNLILTLDLDLDPWTLTLES